MMLKAFCIFDSKADVYLLPFFSGTTADAMRSFGDAVNDGSTQFAKHPSDYTLFHVGSFDNASGKLSSLDVFSPLGNGVEFVNKE